MELDVRRREDHSVVEVLTGEEHIEVKLEIRVAR